ncbi:hypothetical protein MU0083_000524 [[Mycobacterium] kokjensenii]|uniref:Uncharacterized protein n=1 Tax=[Mycobacterium] kokjensenii TaxID=3064287 RepID=A0ABM9L789_9MYCO|nr:hypothetical protein [Mycolicibacter sp. MU0083]CAJ1493848.1 hypothetical protein MU0083_000524 [Mycolicibacter sp. MU0083]
MSTPVIANRYGPNALLPALAAIAVVGTTAWMWLLYWIADLYLFGVATLLVIATGFLMAHSGVGRAAHIGRGMLVGYLAAPLTIALVVIPPVLLNQLLHLV